MRRHSKKGFRRKFQVEVTETLQKIVDIYAFTAEEAIAQVTQKYREGDIVLDSGDFIDFSVGIWW